MIKQRIPCFIIPNTSILLIILYLMNLIITIFYFVNVSSIPSINQAFLFIVLSAVVPSSIDKIKSLSGLNIWEIERVSSIEQGRKGNSLQFQEEWFNRIKSKFKFNVLLKTKVVMSGKIFPKKYYKKAIQTAKKTRIDAIAVRTIDRFSRNFAAGVRLLEDLNKISRLKIITESRIYNWSNLSDQFFAGFELLMAQRDQGDREEKSFFCIETMLNSGMWPFAPPFGYEKLDRRLKIKDGYGEVIRCIFSTFLHNRNYGQTARIVNKKFGEDMGFSLIGQHIKKIITNPVYIGLLKWNKKLFGNGDEKNPWPNLQVIDNKTFAESKLVVENISNKYSRQSHDIVEVLMDVHGYELVLETLEYVPRCRNCGYVNVSSNGTGNQQIFDKITDGKYICPNCSHQFRSPTKKQIKKLEKLSQLACYSCGKTGCLRLVKEDGAYYKLECKNCKSFLFLREYNDKWTPSAHKKKSSYKIKSKKNYPNNRKLLV